MAAPKLTPPPPTGIGPLDRWLNLLWRLLTAVGQFEWSQVSKVGSNLTDIETRNHNDLQTVQGGNSTERYHLTAAEQSEVLRQDNVVSVAVNTVLDDTHCTVIATVSGLTITLPAASTARIGKKWHVVQSVEGTVAIVPAGADTIVLPDGNDTILTNINGTSLALRCISATSWSLA